MGMPICVCMSVCMCVSVCLQLAETASQLEGPLLSWRDQIPRLAWCIRFAPVTKRSEYVTAPSHYTVSAVTLLS